MRNIFISPDGFLFDRNKLISEEQLVGGIVETSNLKHTNLNVHGEGVEAHRADEGDATGHSVQEVVLSVHPEALQLAQDQVGLE